MTLYEDSKIVDITMATTFSHEAEDPPRRPPTLQQLAPAIQQHRYSMPNIDDLETQSETLMARFLGLSDDETERLSPGSTGSVSRM